MIKNYTDKEYSDKAVEANSKGLSLYILVTPTEFTGTNEQGQPYKYTEDVATLVLAEEGYYVTYNGNYTDGTINDKLDEEKANERKQTFYTQFIQTSLGNYRLQPKGYANAQQAMDVTNTMATALGGFTEQLINFVIFYETPDFTKEEECTEEWLVAHQIKPNVMTLAEWQKFYLEFCQLYAMQQYKTTVNGGNNENTTDTEQSTDVSNEMETEATDEPNAN